MHCLSIKQHDCDAENRKFTYRIFERQLTMFCKISKFEKLSLDTVRYILASFHPSLLTTVTTLNIFLTFFILLSAGGERIKGMEVIENIKHVFVVF